MARTKLIESNKPEKYVHVVRNAETVSIPKGTPVVLNLSTTPQPSTYSNGNPAGFEDGLQVVLPTTAGAFNCRWFQYGIALGDIQAGQLGEVQVHGVVAQAMIKRATRASSGDSWSASASTCSIPYLLTIDTIDNCLTTIASSDTYASNTSITLYNTLPFAILIDSLTSIAASASATTDTRTVITVLRRVFLRQM